MPELPEVETIRRDLNKFLSGKKITAVEVRQPRLVKPSVTKLKKALVGARVGRVSRRGKMLVWHLPKQQKLLVHLKMTGQIVWRQGGGKLMVGGHPIIGVDTVPNKYTHITVSFTGGGKLYFNDTRKFGYWRLVDDATFTDISQKNFGPEPLSVAFNANYFLAHLKKHQRAPIKAILLDQKTVAGIGNIYADESLWLAKVKPQRWVGKLHPAEIKLLVASIKKILKEAVKYRGTSFNSYVDSLGRAGTYWPHRKVYGRGGLSCKRCGTIILKTRVAGRGTHYCPKCQR
ncbi:MAG: Formamidopyrimidine-DNA glycosylase [Parcubacteria group bacterium GW2011_GWA2_46_39]|nr:MAG: Formamidopyrimidine-DNA glycosylase [Parcubacteria group bacterium GW2011_GWA2_46_39]